MPVATVVIARSASTRGDALRRVPLWLAACVGLRLALVRSQLAALLESALSVPERLAPRQQRVHTPSTAPCSRSCFDGSAEYSFKTGTTAIFSRGLAGGFWRPADGLLPPGVWLALRHRARRPHS
jgi:hypothetical protein